MSLNEQIEKIVKANGADFYGTETVQENDSTIFRVYITKEGGVKLDLCAEISNELSVFFDVNPPMHGAYFLEVSFIVSLKNSFRKKPRFIFKQLFSHSFILQDSLSSFIISSSSL